MGAYQSAGAVVVGPGVSLNSATASAVPGEVGMEPAGKSAAEMGACLRAPLFISRAAVSKVPAEMAGWVKFWVAPSKPINRLVAASAEKGRLKDSIIYVVTSINEVAVGS